jgi:hypothetical protein
LPSLSNADWMALAETPSSVRETEISMFKLAEYLPPFPNVTWTLARQAGVTHAVSQVPPDDVNGPVDGLCRRLVLTVLTWRLRTHARLTLLREGVVTRDVAVPMSDDRT